jgi:hypothetical protein
VVQGLAPARLLRRLSRLPKAKEKERSTMSKTKNKYLYPMPAGTVKANLTASAATPDDVTLATLKTALGLQSDIQDVMEIPKKLDDTYTEFYKQVLNTSFPWKLETRNLKGVYVRLGTIALGTAPTIKLRKYSSSTWTNLTNAFTCPTTANTESDESSEIVTGADITEGDILDVCITDAGSADAENLQVVTVWEI